MRQYSTIQPGALQMQELYEMVGKLYVEHLTLSKRFNELNQQNQELRAELERSEVEVDTNGEA